MEGLLTTNINILFSTAPVLSTLVYRAVNKDDGRLLYFAAAVVDENIQDSAENFVFFQVILARRRMQLYQT